MKNLKFRIWDKQLKVFLYQLPEKHHLEWKRFDIQQFTGLLDKSGKEIYEGDIVRLMKRDKKAVDFDIKPRKDCWLIEDIKEATWLQYYIEQKGDEYKVIGNIYEHASLLDNK